MQCSIIEVNRSGRHRGQVVPHLGRRHHLGVAAEAEQDPGRCHPAEPQPHHGPLRVVPAVVVLAVHQVRGRFAIAGYIQEILAHGWDLSKATGQPTEGDPELALWALTTAKRILPPDIRGDVGVPFGPVVEVSPDAAPYTQLAAWLGRHP